MMKKLLLTSLVPLAMASLARPASAADASQLKLKFASALTIVSDVTASIVHKPMHSTANLQAAYGNGGAVAASITVSVKTDAQELLLETSDLVRDLAYALIAGTTNPNQELQDRACELTKSRLEKRRFASFYDGYEDVHQEFKDFL